MKILMVAMASLHFFRWTEQLKGSGHDIYWFDILDGGEKVQRISWTEQKVNWKRRWEYPGRFFIKKNAPTLYSLIGRINNRSTAEAFENYLKEVRPDVVQSFVMYSACAPLRGVMKKYPGIKWLYSAWGNDLFYYQNDPFSLSQIKKTLPELDYMFADCKRDFEIAKKYGFRGKFLGAYPGGGGYDFSVYDKYSKTYESRKTIIIKGYEHHFGRCNNVLKALLFLKEELKFFDIIIFGANEKVSDFVTVSGLHTWANLTLFFQLPQIKVIELMGSSVIYIGNSISDGMPNTLLEAIVMKTFPIQSNPGGVTEEVITHGENGLLIEDPEDIDEIASHIRYAIKNPSVIQKAIAHNSKYIRPELERSYIQTQVLKKYRLIENETQL